MHPLPNESIATAPACSAYTHDSGWSSYLTATPLTICDGHSQIVCAMRAPQQRRGAQKVGYFCWIRGAYEVNHRAGHREWRAYCAPTRHWSGRLDDKFLIDAFGKRHNHFQPIVPAGNVRPYLSVHRPSQLPARLRFAAEHSEVAYLLNGDQVTLPNFNPWHGSADVLNLFVVQRMLASPSVGGSDGAKLAANLSIYPVAGCQGFGPGRGSHDLWKALTPAPIHSPAPPLLPAGHPSHSPPLRRVVGQRPRPRGRGGRRLAEDASIRRLAAVVLSPAPRKAPIWSIPGARFSRCPHRSDVLHDFRRIVSHALDASAPAVPALLRAWRASPADAPVRLFTAPPSSTATAPTATAANTSAAVASPPPPPPPLPTRLVYVVRRSSSKQGDPLACRRCLWNVVRLCEALAAALPGATVVLANPGELPFGTQYALFRESDLLLGVHGSAFAWSLFLTPSQAVSRRAGNYYY